jgi:hypothetical protein
MAQKIAHDCQYPNKDMDSLIHLRYALLPGSPPQTTIEQYRQSPRQPIIRASCTDPKTDANDYLVLKS